MSTAEEPVEPTDAAMASAEPADAGGTQNHTEEHLDDVEVIDLTGLSSGSEAEDDDDDDDEGSESEVEIQLNAETREQLRRAILTVSETRLRHVLANLLETDQAVEIALAREFITVQRDTQKVIARWYRCVQCDIEFDGNTLREEDECAFHPGK
jgi:2-polyprenyl-6-methoxyphenol hydroxylase-like FAD-dependent oxidoreductase